MHANPDRPHGAHSGSVMWTYLSLTTPTRWTAACNACKVNVARGGGSAAKYNTATLIKHLHKHHQDFQQLSRSKRAQPTLVHALHTHTHSISTIVQHRYLVSSHMQGPSFDTGTEPVTWVHPCFLPQLTSTFFTSDIGWKISLLRKYWCFYLKSV